MFSLCKQQQQQKHTHKKNKKTSKLQYVLIKRKVVMVRVHFHECLGLTFRGQVGWNVVNNDDNKEQEKNNRNVNTAMKTGDNTCTWNKTIHPHYAYSKTRQTEQENTNYLSFSVMIR